MPQLRRRTGPKPRALTAPRRARRSTRPSRWTAGGVLTVRALPRRRRSLRGRHRQPAVREDLGLLLSSLQAHLVVLPGTDRSGLRGMTEVLTRSPQPRQGPSTATGPRSVPPPPVDQLKSSLQRLAGVLVDRGAKAALRAVDRLSGKLEDISSRGGALTGAAAGGLKAVAAGKNPVLGAVKGAIGGLSTKTKVLIVLAIVLGLLLGPVALVLLLVGLLVFAIVAAVRSRGPT
jgi:hypothetical protein